MGCGGGNGYEFYGGALVVGEGGGSPRVITEGRFGCKGVVAGSCKAWE